ncbi:MAG TPA: M3 family metallopeptidase [Sphingomicrobium sp.]|nr:M3 family metallopeptidase [Sphingomicrobium sp.]
MMKSIYWTGVAAVALAGSAVVMAASAVAQPASKASRVVPNNILLKDFTGPYAGVPQWDKVRPAQFDQAFQFAIEELRREVAAIANSRAAPTFANTIKPLELAGRRLDRVDTYFSLMTSNLTTPVYQALDKKWAPKLSATYDEISFNRPLFARIKTIYEARDKSGLDAKRKRLVTRTYEQYLRSGAALDDAQKKQLGAYNEQLATLFASFSEKVLADESTYLNVTDAELAGVPDDVKAAAAAAAKAQGKTGFAIKNTRSAVDPMLTFADDRALREKVWRAFVNRGDNNGANDTNATIAQIVKLRADRAKLLGYGSHAERRMQDTMAKTPAKAMDLMMRVWPAAKARVAEEVRDMQALADKSGTKLTIEPWDYRYYMEKVRKERFDLSQDEIKPHFELSNMINGMFWAAGELYDLDFKENTGKVPVFHPDVRTFEVLDRKSKAIVGLFYMDNYAREGKRSGAWATTYRSRSGLTGDRLVLASNNNNFTKPGPNEPVLISLDDADTLFHEFGHGIHSLLSSPTYPGLAGTPRDFVEYPSQVNENWLLTREVLDKFARHYKTGAPMPKGLIDKIQASKTFNQGFATVEYLSSALVDMKLHTLSDGVVDADKIERETLAELGMPKEIVMRHRLPQFNHLFSSDAYSAGYYSYLWSETMDADTWAAFEKAGVWDKATADRFRTTLLSTGNETDRAEAYRAFRGRDPDVTALLKRRGFPVN